jgi:hypothetical protein
MQPEERMYNMAPYPNVPLLDELNRIFFYSSWKGKIFITQNYADDGYTVWLRDPNDSYSAKAIMYASTVVELKNLISELLFEGETTNVKITAAREETET